MDDALHAEVARRMNDEAARRGLEIVFVGSTAAILQRLLRKTSKDVDGLAPPGLSLDEGRAFMRALATDLALDYGERGWGVLTVRRANPDGSSAWEFDLLVPEKGPIPPKAAALIRRDAVRTPAGLAASPEHVLATKAVAYGDSLGKGDATAATIYEGDLLDLRDHLRKEPDWTNVQELLDAYPDARARHAIRILDEVFGVELRAPREMDG